MPKEPPTRPDPLPRLLLLDMTRIGGGTATGEIKRNLLTPWGPSGVLPVANGVVQKQWPECRREAEPDRMILRYAGGLASDMTLDSLVDVAEAVQALSDTHAVRLEINSRPQWVAQAGHRFEGFTAVRVTSEIMRPGAYRRWLSEADISVIPYNFDPETARYVQYSLANKTPECMARRWSGACS